ncbi:MAG: DUF3306 domain-containing protein [Burkholderiaceae bacterium]
MDAEDFFSRWSRRAAEAKAAQVPTQENAAEEKSTHLEEAAHAPAIPAEQRPVTLEDVASLTKDSDYKPFMAKGIDETVKRSAMKKLFADPHFNVMDGLDIYIDDYSVFEPLKPATLLALRHAEALLDPLKHMKQVQSNMLSLLHESEEKTEKDAIENQSGTRQETAQESEQMSGREAGQNAIQAASQIEEAINKEENFEEKNINDAPLENQMLADIPDSTKPAER